MPRKKCNLHPLLSTQNFQEECEAKLKILEEAAASAQKMTTHDDSDEKVGAMTRFLSDETLFNMSVCRCRVTKRGG